MISRQIESVPHASSPRERWRASFQKLTALLVMLATVAGCKTSAQTGALGGAGIGALAGQAIGGSTEATLIGAAVGAGAATR